MNEPGDLERLLETIEREIQEYRRQMPAHSVKPSMMKALMDLEDERDRILSRLQARREKA